MEPLLRENLERAEALRGGRPIRDARLASLWELARTAGAQKEAEGVEVLAARPRRTTMRLRSPQWRSDQSEWFLGIDHARARLPMPAGHGRVIREAHRLRAWHPEVRAEQTSAGFGLIARPWRSGVPVAEFGTGESESFMSAAESVARALAALQRNGWSAANWTTRDLLVRSRAAEVEILPLIGGGFRSRTAPSRMARRADLLRLLASWPPSKASRAVESVLGAYGASDWSAAEVLEAVDACRARQQFAASAACLRASRQFEPWGPQGWRRRLANLAEDQPPELMATSSNGLVQRRGETVWKTYLRFGALGSVRRWSGRGPGRRSYRMLYLLERAGIDAARPLGWRRDREAEDFVSAWVEGRPAQQQDLAPMAVWLADLHNHGIGLRDAKCANFLVRADGRPVLVDADGVQPGVRRRPRDLGRLLAESSAERWPRLVKFYEHAARPLTREERRATAAAARRFRRILDS